MCRTLHSLIATGACAVHMIVRIFMTTLLMFENIFRMILQTFFNFISFMLQMVSLIPLCVVFLLTARLKCFMCGGGGPCPVNRGGACDCLMSLFAIIILFFIFRATGVLDKIFYTIGYAKATTHIVRFVPTPGEITECSRNDTDTEYIFYPIETTTEEYEDEDETTEKLEFSTFGLNDGTTFIDYSAAESSAVDLRVVRFVHTHTTASETDETTSSETTTTTTTTTTTPEARFKAFDEEKESRRSLSKLWWEDFKASTRTRQLAFIHTAYKTSSRLQQWTTIMYYYL